MKAKRWQDLVNLAFGAWLFVSPWAMGYMDSIMSATWNAYLVGAVTMVFAAYAVYLPRAWEEWINMCFGVWMIISPWLLGFATHTAVAMNTVVVGVVVTAMATWAMFSDKEFEKWWHDHHLAS